MDILFTLIYILTNQLPSTALREQRSNWISRYQNHVADGYYMRATYIRSHQEKALTTNQCDVFVHHLLWLCKTKNKPLFHFGDLPQSCADLVAVNTLKERYNQPSHHTITVHYALSCNYLLASCIKLLEVLFFVWHGRDWFAIKTKNCGLCDAYGASHIVWRLDLWTAEMRHWLSFNYFKAGVLSTHDYSHLQTVRQN